MLGRVVWFYAAADPLLIAVIPDDAFYYIQLARHRVADGFWTFDGASPATGFHLLYGYFLAALFWFFGDIGWRPLYLLIGCLASFSIALSALFTFRTVETILDPKLVPIAAIPFFSWEVISLSAFMVESWLVLLFAALTAHSVSADSRPTAHGALGLLAIGVLGSLARTDFGLWPGILFCVFLARAALRGREYNALYRSAFILGGAVVGRRIFIYTFT